MKILASKLLDKPTLSVKELADKWNVSEAFIEDQLRQGIVVESEHTSDKKLAREIALDHLKEVVDYYTRLKAVEASMQRAIARLSEE